MREVNEYGLNRYAIRMLHENISRTEGEEYTAVGVIDGFMIIFQGEETGRTAARHSSTTSD